MVTRNTIRYINGREENLNEFVYTGTAALKRGYGMCFDLGVFGTGTGETITDPWGRRGQREVQLPSASNNLAFAGVLTQNYSADPDGKPKLIQLAMPGGCAMIASIEATNVNATQLTCITPTVGQAGSGFIAQAGLFGKAGLPGRGTALALQRTLDTTDEPRETAYIGDAAYATATGTITATGKFTNAAAGDIVWILSGGVANSALAGKYYIKTVTDVNNVIISLTPGGDAFLTAAANGAKIAIATQPAGEPLTLAYLYDGEESGLVEWDIPVTGGTSAPMVGGTTHLMGGIDLDASDTPPVLDATRIGMKKKFWLGGALADTDYIITPAKLGLAPNGTIAATITLRASLGMGTLEWTGQKWDIVTVNTAAEAT
jgi:hypothetical protein